MIRALFGILILAMAAGPAKAGANDFFAENSKDFGTTPRGPLLQHYFVVKNTTNQNVTIGQPRVSCGCVGAQVLKSVLAPGESTAVLAAMDTRRIPQAYVSKTVTIYVPFYAPVMEEVQLKVTAIARDDLVMTPDTLAFGEVRSGKSASSTVKITLYNNPTWQITETISTGLYVKSEVKLVAKTNNEVTYEIAATLDPKCPVGNWTAEVWLKTNLAGIERIRIPVTVVVSTPISIIPGSVTFSGLEVGKESEQKVTLQGTAAFKILQVKGVDDVVSVKAGAEEARPVHTLTIALKPSAAGSIDKLLEVETDNKEMPRIKIPVRGEVK